MTSSTIELGDDLDFSGSMGADVAKDANKGGDFQREIEFMKIPGSQAAIDAGTNQKIVRFVTDFKVARPDEPVTKYNLPWITAKEHGFVKTKPKPDWADKDRRWPERAGGGCRKDPIFVKRYGGACYFCDEMKHKPSSSTWALAVEREEVRDDANKIIGYRDKTREVFDRDEQGNLIVLKQEGDKKEYAKKTVPAWLAIQQGWKNFFGNLNGQAQYYKTVLDGDWLITRTGETKDDTTYAFIRVAEMALPEGNPYGYPAGTKYDLGLSAPDSEHLPLIEQVYPDMPDLRQIVANRVSDDIVNVYFRPGWTPPEKEGQASGSKDGVKAAGDGGAMMMMTSSAPDQPSGSGGGDEPSSEAMEALRNRLQNKG